MIPKLSRGYLNEQAARRSAVAVLLLVCLELLKPDFGGAQALQIVNMAIPSKSFQMVIYPLAAQKGYMKEENDQAIYASPGASIQAMLGGDVLRRGVERCGIKGQRALKVIASPATGANGC
jgi:hypothetical protein